MCCCPSELPTIAPGTRSVTDDVGATVTLPLSLSFPGLPVSTVEWYKGTTPLSTGGRFTMDAAGSLTITNLVAEDRGDYQARVSNSAGTVPVNYQLFVNCKSVL